jgi:hypothetical protein
MKAIDVKTCIGKEVILLDHLRINSKDYEANSETFLYSSQTRPASVLAVSPGGQFVLVSVLKENVVDSVRQPITSDDLLHNSLVEAIKKLSPSSSARFVMDRTWIPIDDFNEAGADVPTNMNRNNFESGVLPGSLKRFSVVEIVDPESCKVK